MTSVIETTKVELFARFIEGEVSPPDRDWLLLDAPALTGEWIRLELDMQRQQQDQWCWAAVSISLASYYGVDQILTQCELVNAALGLDTCCWDGTTAECNRPWYLDRALKQVGALQRLVPGTPTDLEGVLAEIDGQRPVGVHVQWRGSDAGHFVVIEGYRGDGRKFAVEDPWWGTSDVDVDTLRNSYQGTGRWDYTFYTGVPS